MEVLSAQTGGICSDGLAGRDPDMQEKLPQLLRHLDAQHATLFGINARVLRAGRIAAGESVATDPPATRR